VFYSSLLIILVGSLGWMTVMPGKSHHGPLPALDDRERSLASLLRRDVEALASSGERNTGKKGSLDAAWAKVENAFSEAGYISKSLTFKAHEQSVANIEAVCEGSSSEIVVIGAHYDTAEGAPGADDNGSGMAALFAIARAFEHEKPRRTLRFVAFVNEEPPHFWMPTMGSVHYAQACKERGDNIVAMLSLETLGYYRDEPGTQKYPLPGIGLLYPDRGDFVAFIGNVGSRSLVRETIGAFREAARFPSEGAALPNFIPGIGWSDHWSFWQAGYDAVMVTDTAPFRNPSYHTARVLPDTLDYERLARVTAGLITVVGKLAR
jgi:Zn-dependent M28 family amino/carboxypeptidase